jgi:CBS domain-containing protein
MHVHAILKTKSASRKGPAVVTADPKATLAEVARSLADNNIGAVVVTTTDGRVAGIFSERDIVRHVAKSGAAALDKPVADLMTKAVITCTAEDSIDAVMTKMTRGRFRHVPVIGADARLVGLVSIGDVVKHHVEEIEHEATALRDYITQPH